MLAFLPGNISVYSCVCQGANIDCLYRVLTKLFEEFHQALLLVCNCNAVDEDEDEDENPEQLHTTLPLAVTTTVCGAVPEKLATMKVFLESDVDVERDSVG